MPHHSVSIVMVCAAVAACGGGTRSTTGNVMPQPAPPGSASAGNQNGNAVVGSGTASSAGASARSAAGGVTGATIAGGGGGVANNAGATAGSTASAGAAGNALTNAAGSGSRTAADPRVPPEVAQSLHEWPLPGKDYDNSRYTRDSPINSSNVGGLKEAWRVRLSGLVIAYGMISTVPIITGATVYLEDTYSSVHAIDLASGRVKWEVQSTSLNPGPNGVAVGWGNVYAIRGSDSVVAFDAATGKELWVKRVVDTATAGIDIQPTVFDAQVLVSTCPISTAGIYTGGDRGILKALDPKTGEERWRFDTIQSKGDVWGNANVNSGGGAWYPPSIDLETGRVFWAIANPAPFPGTAAFPNGTSRVGENLYTDSTLVLDVHTGSYQWHHQTVQHDLFDRDLLHTILTVVNGVPAVISTGKEGRVWANRRDTGEVLWGPVEVGMHMNDELTELKTMTTVLPGSFGGVLTPPALAAGVVYVAVLNAASRYSPNQTSYFGSQVGVMNGNLVALDAATGRTLWDVSVEGDPTGGVTVVNDLVITATFQGKVFAYQRETGKEVWRWTAPGGINSWLSVSGDTLVIPAGTVNPAVVVALRLNGTGTTTGASGTGSPAAGSGGTRGPAPSANRNSFSAIYRDILVPRCAGSVCHSGASTGGSLDIQAGATASALRSAILAKPASGSECAASGLSLVAAGNPDLSLLYRKLIAMPPCGSQMPPTGALSADEVGRIRTWIANGALDD